MDDAWGSSLLNFGLKESRDARIAVPAQAAMDRRGRWLRGLTDDRELLDLRVETQCRACRAGNAGHDAIRTHGGAGAAALRTELGAS